MQIQERNLKEIQEKAGRMSDFLKMEYLENVIQKFHDKDIHRFCFLELSRLYEARKMYSDSIKYIFMYQETLVSQEEKNKAMIKEVSLLIKAAQYDRADLLVKKILEHSKEKEKFEVIRKVIELYKNEAMVFEKERKNSASAKIYEKLIPYLNDPEKTETKRRLVEAYRKLGRIRDSIELERSIERRLI